MRGISAGRIKNWNVIVEGKCCRNRGGNRGVINGGILGDKLMEGDSVGEKLRAK